jgi:galactokinase
MAAREQPETRGNATVIRLGGAPNPHEQETDDPTGRRGICAAKAGSAGSTPLRAPRAVGLTARVSCPCRQLGSLGWRRLQGAMSHPDERPDACEWFARQYGREPEGSWFAPGRVNLMGGPDYNDVFVLPFALGSGVAAAAARRPDRHIALTSRQAGGDPVLLSIDTLEPGSVGGWAAYAAGVAWALREAGYLADGADVAIDADLPLGAGLSSSAALECSVALALTELYERSVPRSELARLARLAENEFVGVPSGVMDQLAVFLCRADHALLLDCRTGTATEIPLNPASAGLQLLATDTRVRRALLDGRYAARRQACQDAALMLGARSLREITGTPEALARLTEPVLQRAASHVVSEHRRVLAAADLLGAGELAGIGGLLTASHLSLRDQFEVSWPEADAAVEAAVDAGALGARMTGGGFGGCVVTLVPADRAAQVRESVTERFAQRGWPAPYYLDAAPSGGARRIR